MHKKISILLSLFLTSCGPLSFNLSMTWQNLPEEEAQTQSEFLLYTLNEDTQAFTNAFHPNAGITLELVEEVLEMTEFRNPENIIVTKIEDGVYYYERDGFSASKITGDIDCEYNHDGLAQFYFTLAYNQSDKTWSPIGFSIEECLATKN